MATRAAPVLLPRADAPFLLTGVVLATLVVRVAAMLALDQPLESDGLAYFTMARTLAETGVATDQWGNHAFFSAGYPLLLAPVFWISGASVPVALLVNLLLAAAGAVLVWAVTRRLGGGAIAAAIAGLIHAAWLPGIWSATLLARENLSVPLMLGFVLSVLHLSGARPARASLAAGLCYGAGLVAGSSVVLSAAGMAVALLALAMRRGWPAAMAGGLIFAAAAAVPVLGWVAEVDHVLGRPMLTTNTAFNLYIGNNPAATGEFVSVRYTPIGPAWHAELAARGEVGMSDWVAGQVRDYVVHHPGRVLALAAAKLVLFWAPNLPGAEDFASSRTVAMIRLAEVAQYFLILLLAVIALLRRQIAGWDRAAVLATIAGFWMLHAAAYIILRYRDPVMPLLIVLAGLAAARLTESRRAA